VFAIILTFAIFIPTITWASALLSPQDLQAVQPDLERFLDAVADLLEQKGLLESEDRQDWIDCQLGDFFQNGGYGVIAILYNPDLIALAEPDTMAFRITVPLEFGWLRVDTLRAFMPQTSVLPGMPLDANYQTEDGTPLACRFRWSASGGQLLMWDALAEGPISLGASLMSEGQPIFWAEAPIEDARETILLEVLDLDTDELLGGVTLTVQADEQRWRILEEE